ncbi:MAG: MFS transporter [Hyphomicrobiales bacterium]|nr:MFS transporter [Hyphomicrobiales bacterium]
MKRIWIVIACAGAIMCISAGARQTLGLFLAPISLEHGFGRETFALGMGIMNLIFGLGSPFAGAISDRYGAGRVVAAGALVYAAGLMAMTLSGDGEQLLLGGTLLGLGMSATGATVILGTVGRAVPAEQRSRALGLVAMFGSTGQFLALPSTHLLIDGFGWVAALTVLAAAALLVAPLAAGIAGRPASADAGEAQSVGEALGEARQTRSFWLLGAGFFVCGFHVAFVAIHFPAFLSDQGLAAWVGAAALTVIGVGNMLGSYVWGALGGHYPKKAMLSLLYLLRAALFLMLLLLPLNAGVVLAFSAIMGFLWLGTVPLTSALVGHIFGTRYMSMLFGIVFLSHQCGAFLGAWLAGYSYDALGSYDAMWWLSIALGLGSALLHWPIEERPVSRTAAEERS